MKLILYIGVLVLALTACKKDTALPFNIDADCESLAVSYQDDIVPLIQQSCATNQGPGTGCHDAWIFEYDNVLLKVNDGTIQNRVIGLKDMPPEVNSFSIAPLTQDEINLFGCWIIDGAQNN